MGASATGKTRWQITHQRSGYGDVRAPIRLAVARQTGVIAATVSVDNIGLIDPATGKIFRNLKHPSSRVIRAIDISPDGTRLFAAGSYLLQIWRLDAFDAQLEALGMEPGADGDHLK